MQINGTDYNFTYNIFARCELDKECTKAGYNSFNEVVRTSYARAIVMLAVACSRGYEYSEYVKDQTYKQKVLDPNTVLLLPEADFAQLDVEVNLAFNEGTARTVEDEPPKRKNAASTRKSH